MTIIQPHKKALLNYFIGGLVILLGGAALGLVVAYNHLVNLDHGASRMNVELKELQSRNAELRNKIFTLFSDEHLGEIANTRQLVKDQKPQYLTVDERWSIASQR